MKSSVGGINQPVKPVVTVRGFFWADIYYSRFFKLKDKPILKTYATIAPCIYPVEKIEKFIIHISIKITLFYENIVSLTFVHFDSKGGWARTVHKFVNPNLGSLIGRL